MMTCGICSCYGADMVHQTSEIKDIDGMLAIHFTQVFVCGHCAELIRTRDLAGLVLRVRVFAWSRFRDRLTPPQIKQVGEGVAELIVDTEFHDE